MSTFFFFTDSPTLFERASTLQSNEEATALFVDTSKRAANGNNSAQYLLYAMLKFGKGTPKDQPMAVYWLKAAAQNDNAGAQFELAKSYFTGQNGIKQDNFQGTYWQSKAITSGHIEAKNYSITAD